MTTTTEPNVNTVFTKEQEELLDYIADHHVEFAEYLDDDESEQTLIDELADAGIETREDFEDRYAGHFDNWNAEAEFTEQLMVDCGYIDEDHPLFNFIDWTHVWEAMVSYDYGTILGVYFFRSHA